MITKENCSDQKKEYKIVWLFKIKVLYLGKKIKRDSMKIYEIRTLNSDAEHITTIKVDGDNIEVISARDDWDDDIDVTIKEKTKK